jgi:phage-related protein (TIGR01555 family)
MSHPAIRRTGRPGGLTLDGLSNVISGFGTSKDKRHYDTWTFTAPITQMEVESAYRTSWLGRKIHDLPPFDMVRAWRDWQAEADQIEALEAEERRLGLRQKVRKALVWSRLYGGGALILGAAGDPAMPLNIGAVDKGGLKYVHAVTRYQLSVHEIEADLASEFFGQPKHYELSSVNGAVRIHPSRVIPFIGQPVPEGATGVSGQDQFWGDPLLQSLREAIAHADLAQAASAGMMHEAKIDTLSIPDLSSQLSTSEYEARLISRLQVAELAKSVLNSRILDAEEKWETRQINFSGLPDMLDKFLQIVAAAADIPVTRLLGTSAKGLNATGEGDNDNYDEMIASRQELDLRPNLERLDEVLIRSALGVRPPEVHFIFADLEKPDPKEKAEIEDKRADTAKKYVDAGLVPLPAMAKAAQNALIERSVYPGLEASLEETKATVGLPIEMFKALLTAWQSGGSPLEVVHERLKAAGLTSMEFDAFREAIEAGGPALGTMEEPEEGEEDEPEGPGELKDAAPRPLYVRRDVVNHAEIEAWAKSQGFRSTLGAKMHVTVLYSRQPVDWLSMGENWSGDGKGQVTIQPGGPRLVEPLGDKGAITLLFVSTELQWRHRNMVEAGASHDYPDYTPHITISYEKGDANLDTIEPYRGRIVLGPEIFETIDEDWASKVIEA